MDTDIPLISGSKPKRKLHPAALAALIVIPVVLIIAAVVIVIVFYPAKKDDEPTTDYGIIIDAGSSGSRIYVYDWPHRKDTKTVPVVSPVVPNSSILSVLNIPRIRQLRSILITDESNTFVLPS